jgi:poly(beta-D-mannuronate) lyase
VRIYAAFVMFGCVLLAPTMAAAQGQSSCAPAPPAVRDLNIPRFYANAEGSSVDPKLAALHAAAVEPLVAFVRDIVDAADAGARGKDKDVARAQCALVWLQAWAAGDAWLGDMVTQQAEYQRKWDLAGIALAYVKLKPHATASQRAVIEPWLQRWAAKARAFFDNPERKRNNHWYWLGLGLMATSLATDSAEHWSAADAIYRDAMRDIRADGVLPMELDRQERALHYHIFAMLPLVVMADIAARRGADWYSVENGALHRLVTLCATGLVTPSTFETIAGKPQEQPVNVRAGWLTLYAQRFPERLRGFTLPPVPDKNRWLGGDVRLLMQALEPRR